jgi:hypothetical protein
MMRRWQLAVVVLAFTAACGQQQQPPQQSEAEPAPVLEDAVEPRASLPPVDPDLLAAPSSSFTAIEPTEVGIIAAPSVLEALEPVLGPEMAEGGALHLTITAQRDDAVADVVRTGMEDDSVRAGHLRIEFRREPDGWFPTNAYRRSLCARGAQANQWTSGLCP